MSGEQPVLTAVADGVGSITLNRPQAMNAITVGLAEGLERALAELAPQVSVIVIRGAGGNFCVGGDFNELEALRARGPAAMAGLFAAFGRACALVAAVDVPVVTVVEGYAMAGGFELMQAADIALVADDAKLADNHSNFGQVPGGGGSQLLPRLVGRQRATAHILLGDRISGAEAAAWGLAYRAVPRGDLDEAAAALAARLAGKTREAQARTKRLIRDGLELPLAEGVALERRVVVEHLTGEAAGDGIASFTTRGAR
ncbi:enoyl-CoA hydratase/isomerase family protein [Conexibacter stalactiti]|uniref:Enoyl-CoA hydratase/isomerase family protein n=1 Tax=Conexibacter stalactiti TaxID=1940611 RepID=A0ABU4HIN4_9ACTN|nr:enoyl-CoA hydratase/isomerase family protein [Conexibacter stalactiti]MDW5593181.1 enoyl-CoA hydratase/isomerase family protein [Conexibacter stalactiti]MEC5033822.1 enoyl-CoA hydratase/isomerase family protein [Conexibacter stalactiti]